jgi:lipoate---protein ligase
MITEKLKTEDGKVVELSIRLDNGVIKEIDIEGDFYAYPEEKFSELVQSLKGIGRAHNGYAIAALLSKKKREHGIEMAGFDEYDIAKLIERVLR